ncbi:MAG: hypothetical protein LAO79_24050 [Acidobacteriia bacterium]|nr:hypothetical protein [Terriglobia bacterium]
MAPSRLYPFAILLAAGALVLIVTGAAVTSLRDQPSQPFYASVHVEASYAVAALNVAFLIWLAVADRRQWRIVLTAIVLAAGAINGRLGTTRVLSSSPNNLGTLHAWISAPLFAAIVVIAWSLSPFYDRDPELVRDQGWPSLRSLTTTAVLLLLMQIEFGAGYRHSTLSVIPHLLGAPFVTLILMVAGAFVSQQFPKHGTLKPLAVAVLIITSIQVALGMTTFIVGLTITVMTPLFLAVRLAHVATGSVTLAAGVMLAIEVRRKVQPKQAS